MATKPQNQLLRRRVSMWRNTFYETQVKRADLKLNVDQTLRKPSSRVNIYPTQHSLSYGITISYNI